MDAGAQISPTLQGAIAALSGLSGALLGGLISLWQSRRTIEETFRNQIEIEELRHRQKLELEDIERRRRAAALRRSLLRALKRLHNASRLSPRSRITLSSWLKAAAELGDKMDQPDVDFLLSEKEYDALWTAADEGTAAATTISYAADWASQGYTPNAKPLRATVDLFQASLRDAFEVLSEAGHAREVDDERRRGISGCGIFLDKALVFYPVPIDRKSFIVRAPV